MSRLVSPMPASTSTLLTAQLPQKPITSYRSIAELRTLLSESIRVMSQSSSAASWRASAVPTLRRPQ
ncbi:MAG: hypothetical protein ACI4IV_07730 [Acutalibacteraceae bacterium]